MFFVYYGITTFLKRDINNKIYQTPPFSSVLKNDTKTDIQITLSTLGRQGRHISYYWTIESPIKAIQDYNVLIYSIFIRTTGGHELAADTTSKHEH